MRLQQFVCHYARTMEFAFNQAHARVPKTLSVHIVSMKRNFVSPNQSFRTIRNWFAVPPAVQSLVLKATRSQMAHRLRICSALMVSGHPIVRIKLLFQIAKVCVSFAMNSNFFFFFNLKPV